ncbi:Sodium-independent sulfate anion transporter [Camponotus floridanus]|uniref:Sodium-independent sulfate anion transporter n=1 Tax=Camponotus floridanus TaxID=104421 RepID=E2A218_CAMFO|nr:Sodium-independent sulfate anion transporter [Camponotus floridanus]
MKNNNNSIDSEQRLEGYVNHGLSESTNNVDLIHSYQSFHNSHGNHRDIQGSSDFILIEESGDDEVKQKEGLLKSALQYTRRRARAICKKKTLYKRLPVLSWIPRYNSQDALGDLVAGITVGLTVIPQSLAYSNVAGLPPQSPIQHAILLSFIAGIVELIMGIFGLGFLINFVSGPVSSGFTSAVALIIVTSQIKDILGIPAKGAQFIEMWQNIGGLIHETSAWDATLGASCIALLLILRLLAACKIGPDKEELRYIPGGMPAVQIPPFGYIKDSNTTLTFIDMIGNLGSGILVIPLISLMEDIAICKAFANGKAVDATQELIAIGMSNIGNSFMQAFPGSGSLSRSAVNNASGVRTPLGGVYTGVLVILSLLFLTPYFSFIPRATLAAIIIAAVIFMVEVKVVKPMWRTKKSDLIPGVGTFIACLVLQLEIGILCGVGINILFILYHAARPKITVEKLKTLHGIEYLMLTPDRCLIFPSVDYVRNLVNKYSRRAGSVATPVVIDCSYIYGADFTAATVIETLTKDFASRGQPLFFYNLKPSVYAVFEGIEPTDFNVYYTQETLDDLLKKKGYTKQIK